jgi:hypothetical protein
VKGVIGGSERKLEDMIYYKKSAIAGHG